MNEISLILEAKSGYFPSEMLEIKSLCIKEIANFEIHIHFLPCSGIFVLKECILFRLGMSRLASRLNPSPFILAY